MCEKCGHLPKSGYIGVGGCCVPEEKQINYEPPELEVDENGVLTDKELMKIYRDFGWPDAPTGKDISKMHLAAYAAVEGYKAWLAGEIKNLPTSSHPDIFPSPLKSTIEFKQQVLALLKEKL